VLIPLLLGSSALAFAPADDIYIGIEPQRIVRFHDELQHKLRHSDGWQDFLSAEGEGWQARFDERAGTVYRAWGPGIELGSLGSVEEAADAVLALLEGHPDLLGVSADALQLGKSGYDAERDTFYIQLDRVLPDTDAAPGSSVFAQPVTFYRSGVLARIKYGKLVLLGIDTHPDADVSGDAAVSLDSAVDTAIAAGPAPQADHEYLGAKKVVLPIEQGSGLDYRLTWEVRTETLAPRGIWVSFVDAQTGELLNVHNEVRYVSGTMSAEHDIRYPGSGTATAVLTYLDLTSNTGDTEQTDETGFYDMEGSEATAALAGEYITTSNQQGSDGSLTSYGDGTFTTADASAAEIDTYHFLTEAIEWADEYAPDVNSTWFNYYGTVVSNVNINSNCNAYYDGNVNFYRAGGGCNNTGQLADVIYHEWGHGFHYLNAESGTIDGSVSEGVGDSIATFFTEDYVIAPYFSTGGSGIREVSTNRVYPDDIINQVHTDGLIFGGSVWDFWGELEASGLSSSEAREVLFDVFIGGMKGGPTIPSAYDEFVVADDDDGDLGNGTPHLCALIDGFSPHGLGPGGSNAVIKLTHNQVGNQLDVADVDVSADFVNLAEQCSDGDLDSADVVYTTDGGESWDRVALDLNTSSLDGIIPSQESGTVVEYYVEGETTEGTIVSAPDGGEITPISFYVGELIEVYCNDFEDDDGGFTSELVDGEVSDGADDWMWGTPNGLEGDPAFAYSGDKVWGNDLGGTINGQDYNGAYQSEKHNRLLSPVIDVSEFGGPYIIQFQRWLTVEDGYYDQAQVTVNDKAAWTNHVSEYSIGDEHHRDSMWALQTVVVDESLDGLLQVGWEIISDGGLEFGGWNVDDFCVYALSEGGDGGGDDTDDGIDNGGDSLGDGVNGEDEKWGGGCSTLPASGSTGLLAGLMALGFVGLRRRRS
jgi:hypothetical protein